MDKRVILFAPTFRNDGKDTEDKNVDRSGLDQMKQMDPDRLFDTLSRRFGGDWVLVCRFHYHVEKMMDWDALGNRWAGRVINGNLHQDMADYLACADVLLTDASSCMFDFALTGRPCFLLFPDLAHYRDRERGFYTDIEALPYECCTDFSGLLSAIERFEGESYRRGIEKMMREFGFSEDGHAAKRVVDYILKDMAKK